MQQITRRSFLQGLAALAEAAALPPIPKALTPEPTAAALTTGIGRGSPRVLDNLGINTYDVLRVNGDPLRVWQFNVSQTRDVRYDVFADGQSMIAPRNVGWEAEVTTTDSVGFPEGTLDLEFIPRGSPWALAGKAFCTSFQSTVIDDDMPPFLYYTFTGIGPLALLHYVATGIESTVAISRQND